MNTPLHILVTGGWGFIGREVVAELLEHGHTVRVADNLSAVGARRVQQPGVESVQVDLLDPSFALRAFEGMDLCIALAARSGGIGFFNGIPAEILDENVRIISATFNAALTSSTRIVYISSSCVFDNSDAYPITEDSIRTSPPPPSGYAFSKFIGESYCEAYLQQYQLPYTIVRPFNVYGPGEEPGIQPGESHVIPDLTQKILRGEDPLKIFGDGSQTRSFTHVKDVARGIVLAAESDRVLNEAINFGHPVEISISKLAGKLWNICGRTNPLRFDVLPSFQQDVRRRAVDSSKAKRLLGWEPKYDLDHGLAEYVSWARRQTGVSLQFR